MRGKAVLQTESSALEEPHPHLPASPLQATPVVALTKSTTVPLHDKLLPTHPLSRFVPQICLLSSSKKMA